MKKKIEKVEKCKKTSTLQQTRRFLTAQNVRIQCPKKTTAIDLK